MTSSEAVQELVDEINHLKRERHAVILVHNYQSPEIYDVADYIGDSLGLSRQAQATKADIIVFCGVDFMAETAYILNPTKSILLPTLSARCPMAAQVTVEKLQDLQQKYPQAATVCYVNTSAAIKAVSDICCTSANAAQVVNSLKEETIIFIPDGNLAANVQAQTSKRIIPWNGGCYVHMKFDTNVIKAARQQYPNAEVLVHPESSPEVVAMGDFMGSTTGIYNYARDSPHKEFIIVTETGMVERLRRDNPGKIFYPALPSAVCIQMKKITLPLVRDALLNDQHKITVPEGVRKNAEHAILRMLDVS